jgi:hypothetical protein
MAVGRKRAFRGWSRTGRRRAKPTVLERVRERAANHRRQGGKCSSGASGSPEEEEDKEIMKDGWWTPDLKELQIEEGEKEYFIELHMSGSALSWGEVASERPPAASSTTG